MLFAKSGNPLQPPFLEMNFVSELHIVISQEPTWNRPSRTFSLMGLDLLDTDLNHYQICYKHSSNWVNLEWRGATNTPLVQAPSSYPLPGSPCTYCMMGTLQRAGDGQGHRAQSLGHRELQMHVDNFNTSLHQNSLASCVSEFTDFRKVIWWVYLILH